MSDRRPLHLFEGFGVELEYMIVAADTLDVAPICDRLMHEVAGEYAAEIELGEIAWSNELALHVVELKTNGPAARLEGLAEQFQDHVRRINELLGRWNARLMPTAMHPWMDPDREMRLWPHSYSEVYETFHRIFDCRGHGWANLQSVHLNLPFADDDEFGRLHAAIRLILPILPALAASSPLFRRTSVPLVANHNTTDGHPNAPHTTNHPLHLDNRLAFYRKNAARVPSVTGRVIPERVFTRADYEREILAPMYADIAPHDPPGVLRHEWLNARGAIARFERNTIEIRLLDVQECPHADLAICAAVVAVLRALVEERWSSCEDQQSAPVEMLEPILSATTCDAEAAVIDDEAYLATMGVHQTASITAGALWRRLLKDAGLHPKPRAPWHQALHVILNQGPLARRILCAAGDDLTAERLREVYRRLSSCLENGLTFQP